MRSGHRSHAHGMPGHQHHDEHIGGTGGTHMSAAIEHLRHEGTPTPYPAASGEPGTPGFTGHHASGPHFVKDSGKA